MLQEVFHQIGVEQWRACEWNQICLFAHLDSPEMDQVMMILMELMVHQMGVEQ